MIEIINDEIDNLRDDIIAIAITYREDCNRMVAELNEAMDKHEECLLKIVKELNQ